MCPNENEDEELSSEQISAIGEEIESEVVTKKKSRSKKSAKKTDESAVPSDEKVSTPVAFKDVRDYDSIALENLELETFGIRGCKTVTDAAKLYDQIRSKLKCQTLKELSQKTAEEVAEALDGVGDAIAIEILNKSDTMSSLPSFVPLESYPETMTYLKTNSRALNTLLRGGFARGESYLIYGPYKSGKTQLGLELCGDIQKTIEEGGFYEKDKPRPKVLWFDAEDTLRQTRTKSGVEDVKVDTRSRFQQIADNLHVDVHDILKNVIIVPVSSVADQVRKIKKALYMAKDPINNWALIVVDSLNNLIRSEFSEGRQQLTERSGILNRMIKDLLDLRDVKNAILYVTAQVYENPSATMYSTPENTIRVAGGGVVTHGLNVQVLMRNVSKSKWKAKIIDSSYHDGQEAIDFAVTANGIEDI